MKLLHYEHDFIFKVQVFPEPLQLHSVSQLLPPPPLKPFTPIPLLVKYDAKAPEWKTVPLALKFDSSNSFFGNNFPSAE